MDLKESNLNSEITSGVHPAGHPRLGLSSRTSLVSAISSLPPAYSGTFHTPPLVPRLANTIPIHSSLSHPTRPPPQLWVTADTTSFHQAILATDVQLVQDHLNAGASVHLTDGAGMTTLILAYSRADHPDLILLNLLLQSGARPNVVDHKKWSPLLYAAYRGHTEAVVLLLKHGADVTGTTRSGETALHLANNVQIAESLLLAGADPNALNSFARSPLLLAASRGNLFVVRALLKNGAEPNARDNYMAGALTHCILRNDSHDIIRLILSNGAKVSVADTYGYAPLHHAAAYDRSETVDVLLEAGADVTASASWMGGPPTKPDISHIEAFLDRQGWRANYGGGMTPLHVAAYAGSVSTLSLLLEKGRASVDQRSRRNMTALHFCCQESSRGDHLRIAKVLVEHGANVNARGEGNVLPLSCASVAGRASLVAYLEGQRARTRGQRRTALERR